MAARLLIGVALVANILALVVCTGTYAHSSVSSLSSASATSYVSSSSSAQAVVNSRPAKCRKDKRCPKNEEFSYCTKRIQRPQYCSEKEERCRAKSSRDPCKQGCVCKENYLRADNGTCIPAKQCPIICGTNEVLDNCPADCKSDYCPTEDTEAEPCVRPDHCPPPKCKCAFNHRRASNGSCIPTEDCPPFDCSCKPNEEYNPCPPICPTDDCSQASPTGECPSQFGRIGIILPCNPKCRCIKDYWRLDGICVPYGQCPGVCPDNERYSGCIQGECRALNCTQKDQSVPCVRMDPKYCIEGCVCVEGYLRNQDGICVLEDKCDLPSCPANEELVRCKQGVCRAKYCYERGEDVPCPDIPTEECDSGCICIEHFLRAENGSCVPEDQCESGECPDNERYSGCIQAECRALNCTQKDQSVPCVRMDPKYCLEGCVCIEGYLRNQDGMCVLEDKCDLSSCPANEELVPCMQGVCRAKYCYERGEDVPCPDIPTEECDSGCICIEHFLRAENGSCVPEDQCESGECPDNERYSGCIQGECRALNCTQKDQSVPCVRIDPKYCIKGCVCEEGYLRNQDGICVLEDKCEPKVCPENERYSECIQGECRGLYCFQRNQSVPCVRLDQPICIKGCFCKPFYLRNEDGICVLQEECETVCGPNEEWSTCAQAICRAQNCTQRGKPIACPMIMEGYCEEACVCKEGYLRNANGDCIPENECPCGENEVLDECPMICNTDYCPQSADEEEVCYQSDPCIATCKCRFNYKRAENGTCIPTRECPPFDCSAKSYEEYVACPPICPSDECSKPRLEGRCPFRIGIVLKCRPKCQCIDGYGRVNGTCVPFEECPDLCPANEEYSSCVERTCRPQNCSERDVAMETCPSCDVSSCHRGCVCKENFYRNDIGVCVSYDECGGPMCPYAHEVYTPYFKECPPNICKSLVSKYACDENQKVGPGCLCESGYLRLTLTSPCIPICDCPEMANSPDC